MRIIGGSFGTSGRIEIGSFGIRIKASREAIYPPASLSSVAARQQKERRFAWFTFLIGVVLLGALGWLTFGPLGFLAALVLCIVGSFWSQTRYFVELVFDDGAALTLETNRRQADQLVQLK